MPLPTSAETLQMSPNDSKKSKADQDINKQINAKMQKTSLHFGIHQLTYATVARETLTQPKD
jgi:hypothetical protein